MTESERAEEITRVEKLLADLGPEDKWTRSKRATARILQQRLDGLKKP